MRVTAAGRLRHYVSCAWRAAVFGRPGPLIYGLALTDRCSLSCNGCRIANAGRPDMRWDQVAGAMARALALGCRDLYLTGGEPTLWRDGARSMEDVVREAYRLGFFHVQVYTNGLQGLATAADLVWVSIDGLPATFAARRGPRFGDVEREVRARAHPRVAVIYTIDRHTAAGVAPFLRWVRDTAFPVLGVMFYFHTPYYGRDALFITREERAPIIDEILGHLRDGLPVLNSRSALLALRSGEWARPLGFTWVADVDGEWACCRASTAPGDVCADCGYASCPEMIEALRLRPDALAGMLRYW